MGEKFGWKGSLNEKSEWDRNLDWRVWMTESLEGSILTDRSLYPRYYSHSVGPQDDKRQEWIGVLP